MIKKAKGQPYSRPQQIQVKGSKRLPYRKTVAVKLLEQLATEAARLKYPTVPYLAPRLYRDDTANGLTKCIISFLRLKGWQADRINNTGRSLDSRKVFTDVLGNTRQIGSLTWLKGTGTKGIADIMACIKGRLVAIEVKYGSDRQRPEQKNYQSKIEAAGGFYFIARDFNCFLEWYNDKFECNG